MRNANVWKEEGISNTGYAIRLILNERVPVAIATVPKAPYLPSLWQQQSRAMTTKLNDALFQTTRNRTVRGTNNMHCDSSINDQHLLAPPLRPSPPTWPGTSRSLLNAHSQSERGFFKGLPDRYTPPSSPHLFRYDRAATSEGGLPPGEGVVKERRGGTR